MRSIIKTLAFKLLSPAQLKTYADLRFRLRRSFWRVILNETEFVRCLHYQSDHPFRALSLPELEPCRSSIKRYSEYLQEEFVYVTKKKCLLEPKDGFLIFEPNHIFFPSLPYALDEKRIPSFFWWNRYRSEKSRTHLRMCISLRDIYETNYFHFFNDLLSRLFLLKRQNIDLSLPIVVSTRVSLLPFFKGILKESPFLRGLNWYVQKEDELIESDEIVVSKAMPHHPEYLACIAQLFLSESNERSQNRAIFLTRRGATNGRSIVNSEEIEAVVKARGFEIVDTASMNFSDQVRLFQQTKYLAGIHGAGLTNMLFRSGQTFHLLEIFPSSNIPPHYFWLTKRIGGSYDFLVGDGRNLMNQNFYLNPQELNEKLHRLLSLA